jgi:hypothetical protein
VGCNSLCVAPAILAASAFAGRIAGATQRTQPFIRRTIAVTTRRGEMRIDWARSLFLMPGTTTRVPRFIAS